VGLYRLISNYKKKTQFLPIQLDWKVIVCLMYRSVISISYCNNATFVSVNNASAHKKPLRIIIIIIKASRFYLDQDGDCDDSVRTIQSLVVSAVELGVETVDL